MTVRESDGSVIQFQYGEDSLDVSKSQFMKPGKIDMLGPNVAATLDKKAVKMAKKVSDRNELKTAKTAILTWKKEHGGLGRQYCN